MPRLISINISLTTGTGKEPVDEAILVVGHGLRGDAHARDWHRQISLLAMESIRAMAARHPDHGLGPGSFAENLTTEGLDLPGLPIGTRLKVGSALLEITQIGKKCHAKCQIHEQAGECIMPKQGIFAKVLVGGAIQAGTEIIVI
jgi:MOSC domain-containing protein YiiM